MTHVRKLAWILPLLLAACADTAGPRPVGGDASLAPSSVPAPAPTSHGKIGVAPPDIAPGSAGQVFVSQGDGGAPIGVGISQWSAPTPQTGGGLSYLLPTPRIMALGDSQTAGSNDGYSGTVGGWPSYFVQQLRQWRGDFEMVASQAELPEVSGGSSVVWNEGHPGYTIATGGSNLNTGWPTWTSATAFGGGPDIVIVMAGANDVAGGRTASQMETDWATLHTTIQSTVPNALVVDMCFPPFVAGTTVSTNLSAWNAIQGAFCSWLSGTFVPAHSSTDVYSNCAQSLTLGDRLPDGVHPNQQGESAIGTCVAEQITSLLGVPRGPPQLPANAFRYRTPWASYHTLTAGTDALTLTSHSGVDPGAGSFTFAFDFYPTSFPGSESTIVNYGSYAVNNYYGLLYSTGVNGLCLYWDNTAATVCSGTGATFSTNALTLGQWARIVIMADAEHGVVGLYVNGKLAGLNTAVPLPWSNTQQTLTLGKETTFGSGVPGYFGRVWAAKAVPGEPGGVAALRAVEADYYLGDSLIAGQASASFTLDAILTDDVYAPGDPNPSFVLVSGAASVAAYPGGSPLRPWELDGRVLQSSLYDPTGAQQVNVSTSTTTIAEGLTQSGGAFSLTGNGASQISTTSGALTCDAHAALNLGTTNATSVPIGNSTNTTAISQNITSGGTISNVIGGTTEFQQTSAATTIGDTTNTANINLKWNGSGSLGLFDSSLFLTMNAVSGIVPANFGFSGLGVGTSSLPFGPAYLGASTASGTGYTSFLATGGTQQTPASGAKQLALNQHQVFYGQQSSAGTVTIASGAGGNVFFCPASGSSVGVEVKWTVRGDSDFSKFSYGRSWAVCDNSSGTATCSSNQSDTSVSNGSGLCGLSGATAPTVTIAAGSSGCFIVSSTCSALNFGSLDFVLTIGPLND